MFHSINAYTGETLCHHPAQSYAEFAQELAVLKVHQQAFARLGVTGRTALLQAFAERLAQNKERLAEMVCEEVGRCLHECRAELDKSVELIRYYVRLAPELLAHKTLATLDNDDTLKAIEDTDAMAFTGSTRTGRLLAAHAGMHLKKTVLELGGSNPFIVMPDADLERAAVEACYSRFRDAGQSCNAAKRIVVTEAVADRFIPLFLAECAKLQTGDPKDPATTLAPLHREDLRANVHAQVQDAVAHGAQVLTGGFIPEGKGWFYPATVLDKVNPDCRVWNEEVFGPIAMILRAKDEEHAVALANDTPYGLGASIYTANTRRAWAFAEKIQAGSVFINRHTSSDLRLPFGGVKASGYGRELSEFGLYEFVNVKTYWQK